MPTDGKVGAEFRGEGRKIAGGAVRWGVGLYKYKKNET